jgi:hypothetical protein
MHQVRMRRGGLSFPKTEASFFPPGAMERQRMAKLHGGNKDREKRIPRSFMMQQEQAYQSRNSRKTKQIREQREVYVQTKQTAKNTNQISRLFCCHFCIKSLAHTSSIRQKQHKSLLPSSCHSLMCTKNRI